MKLKALAEHEIFEIQVSQEAIKEFNVLEKKLRLDKLTLG